LSLEHILYINKRVLKTIEKLSSDTRESVKDRIKNLHKE